MLVRKRLGLRYRNLTHYIYALRHKSAARNVHHMPESSNERLEFLGDAVLDAAVAGYLYHKYPHAEEGELTKIKSRIVSRKNLNAIALKMKLDAALETDAQARQSRATLAGNALEALFGAMALDRGFARSAQAILRLLEAYGDLDRVEDQEDDFKSRLFEEAHKRKKGLHFKVESLSGSSGEKYFKAVVVLGQEVLGEGNGGSKKKAEQKAAEAALKRLDA